MYFFRPPDRNTATVASRDASEVEVRVAHSLVAVLGRGGFQYTGPHGKVQPRGGAGRSAGMLTAQPQPNTARPKDQHQPGVKAPGPGPAPSYCTRTLIPWGPGRSSGKGVAHRRLRRRPHLPPLSNPPDLPSLCRTDLEGLAGCIRRPDADCTAQKCSQALVRQTRSLPSQHARVDHLFRKQFGKTPN